MGKKVVYTADHNNPGNLKASPRGRTERDLDEEVHSEELENAVERNNEDPDDRVHKSSRKKTIESKAEENPQDPDDMVHENGDEEDE